MRYLCVTIKMIVLLMMAALLIPTSSMAEEQIDPRSYMPTLKELEKNKAFFDDPRPYLTTFGPHQVCPEEVLAPLISDMDEMKERWSRLVGFKAPDVVGKIAPEIKPGKYTWQEVKQNPGFKELMIPWHYDRIREAGPPQVGSMQEIEVIPTRQYYWTLAITEATEKNAGKTKLDEKGYIVPETWDSGYPFPKPSGKFKAQQLIYNHYHRYHNFELSCCLIENARGFDRFGRIDNIAASVTYEGRMTGRVLFKPYGAINERARKRMEMWCVFAEYFEPRDSAGTTYLTIRFTSPKTYDQAMIYLPGLRRIRKFTATDSQDQWPGYSATYDDWPFLCQKLTPDVFPYTIELLDEREFLVFALTEDGAEYPSSEKWSPLIGMKFERRPVYVVQMTQLDKNYQYSKRILYFDKETFHVFLSEAYDQKGRLYRIFDMPGCWYPKMGQIIHETCYVVLADLVDPHSELYRSGLYPANMPAELFSMRGMLQRGK